MEQTYIDEILNSNDYEVLLKFYSKEELQKKLETTPLGKMQFDILFGPYGVIFPAIETIKDELKTATVSNALENILESNDQEFSKWLEKQEDTYNKDAKNLRDIIRNNPIIIVKEYILEDGQLCSTPVKKLMIENLMSTDQPEVINEVQNLVREVLKAWINKFELKENSEFWLKKYMADHVNNQNDKQLLEDFIAQAKEEKFVETLISCFDPDLVLEWDIYRRLQTEVYQKAILWQEKFAIGKFCCNLPTYPRFQSVEAPDFKAIGNLIYDLRILKKTPDLIDTLVNGQLEASGLTG